MYLRVCWGYFRVTWNWSIDDKEAISDADANPWQMAMNVKLESMYSNYVWNLVEVPKNIKPLK